MTVLRMSDAVAAELGIRVREIKADLERVLFA